MKITNKLHLICLQSKTNYSKFKMEFFQLIFIYILEHFQVLGDKEKSHRVFNNDAISQMQIAKSTQSTKVHSMQCNYSSKNLCDKV